jgi:hypothetical protein
VTLAGTVTSDVFPLESVTTSPPLGAGAPSPTVPVAGVPPGALPLNPTYDSSGNNVMSAANVEPLNAAVMRTLVVAVTELVPIGNDALV